jgi:L-rhamnonate dehydratase
MTRMNTCVSSTLNRRTFLQAAGAIVGGLVSSQEQSLAQQNGRHPIAIKEVKIDKGIVIEADDGSAGTFAGSGSQDLNMLQTHLPKVRELLVGKDPLDLSLQGEMFWEAIWPGKARLYAEGRDPLTGEAILNRPRGSRHTKTGQVFIAFSTVDVALWDLRGKILKKPAYQIVGKANRGRVPVYWRPGEASQGIEDAKRRAREAFDRGYRYQKWYFTKSAKDGEAGLKENIELARVLREELPKAKLLFDNHSIRYYDDVDYSVRLCKALVPYKPFWVEEPICPEHLEGYTRIKGETGITIAGGEHWYTRWPVKAFLDRKCVDYVQSDPTWCGGISEWLKICELVRQYPGVKVVPHITSPWTVAPHCVASQPEELCPLLEFNYEGGRKSLEHRMQQMPDGEMAMTMPQASGIS